MQYKVCGCCGKEKLLSEFHKNKDGKFGVHSKCKVCRKSQAHERYEDKKDHISKTNKKWRENNKESYGEYQKQWWSENKDKRTAYRANRNAVKQALPQPSSTKDWEDVLKEYNGRCAVTGKLNPQLEHFISLSTGHGGSCASNIYPLDGVLNMRKSGKNPYRFLKELKGKQRTAFEKVIHRMAKLNGMTPKEFKKYVNWCYSNPRTLEQILEDNEKGLTSIDLFKLSTQNDN